MFHVKHIKEYERMKLNEQLAVINPEEWILIRTNNTLFNGQKKDIPSIIIERNYKVLKTEISHVIPRFEISVKEV